MPVFDKRVFPKGVQSLHSRVPFLKSSSLLRSLTGVCGALSSHGLSFVLWDQHCLTQLEIRWRITTWRKHLGKFFEKGQVG